MIKRYPLHVLDTEAEKFPTLQKYYLKYTDDKKRYEREMQAYQLKKQEQQEQMQQQLAAMTAANTSTS